MLLLLGGGELLWRGTLEYAQRRTSGAWAPTALGRLAMPLAWLLICPYICGCFWECWKSICYTRLQKRDCLSRIPM